MRPALKIAALLVVALALMAGAVFGAWRGAVFVQTKRADSLLDSGDAHVARANEHMSRTRLGDIGSVGAFSSVDNINRAAAAADTALASLDEARAELESAAADAHRAARLQLIPTWYRDYLETKQQIAELRVAQVDEMRLAFTAIREIYGSGAVIFTSIEDTDRLLGQYEAALGRIPASPAEAREQLQQIASGMRAIKQRLDDEYGEKAFQLLADLSASVDIYAGNIDLSIELAQAVEDGDQSRIQSVTIDLENRLTESQTGTDFLSDWWEENVAPYEESYRELQDRADELDSAAFDIYATKGNAG
jgi:hypothetical protein